MPSGPLFLLIRAQTTARAFPTGPHELDLGVLTFRSQTPRRQVAELYTVPLGREAVGFRPI